MTIDFNRSIILSNYVFSAALLPNSGALGKARRRTHGPLDKLLAGLDHIGTVKI